MQDNILIIHPRDNVAVVLKTMGAGESAIALGRDRISGFGRHTGQP